MSVLFSEDDIIVSKRDAYTTEENLREISKYMDRGNQFGIATNKDFIRVGTANALSKLQYNYIISSNGLVAFDFALNAVYLNDIDKEALEKYLEIIKSCGYVKSYELKDRFGLPAREGKEVIQIACKKDQTSLLDKRDLVNQIDLEYTDSDEFIYFNNPTDIVDGIEALRGATGWDKDSIYTIGNNLCDVQMLTAYHGYRTNDDCAVLRMCYIPKIKNVKKLVRRIKRK